MREHIKAVCKPQVPSHTHTPWVLPLLDFESKAQYIALVLAEKNSLTRGLGFT